MKVTLKGLCAGFLFAVLPVSVLLQRSSKQCDFTLMLVNSAFQIPSLAGLREGFSANGLCLGTLASFAGFRLDLSPTS